MMQMTALGRAYAYLLECKKMTWSAFEAAILRPYTCKHMSHLQMALPCKCHRLLSILLSTK